jgi:hypothetical protein
MTHTIIKPVEKVGRNEDCPCGSGKKFKYCCGGNGEQPVENQPRKVLNQAGLLKCLLHIVKESGGRIKVNCDEIEALPQDEAVLSDYDAAEDAFEFKAVKIKRGRIIQRGRQQVQVVGEA